MTLFMALFVVLFVAVLKWPQLLHAGVRLWVYYTLQANGRAKCPCCGTRTKHRVQYSDALGVLVHNCARCSAYWSEACMVDPTKWRIAAVLEDAEQVDADGTRTTTVQSAQRVPVVVTDYKPTGKSRPVVTFRPGGNA